MSPPDSPDRRSDFPFYTGEPVPLSGRQWLCVLAGVVLAFCLLVAPWTRPPGAWGMWLPALLFCLVPLGALAAVAGRAWTALFGPVRGREVLQMIGIAALNLAVTVGVGLLFASHHQVSANPAVQSLADAGATARAMRFAAMLPQLLGEELLTILPFLACLWWLHTRWTLGRRTSVVLAWVVSAVPFALVHLPTYGWNLMQCLVVIGTARLVLSLGYLLSRNLWVSTGAHVLNDWTLFGAGLLAATGRA